MDLFVLISYDRLYLRGLLGIIILQIGDLLFDDPKLFFPAVYLLLLYFLSHCLHLSDKVVPKSTLAHFFLEARDNGNWFCHRLFLKIIISVQGLLQFIE